MQQEVQKHPPTVDRVRHRPIAQLEVFGQTFVGIANIYRREAGPHIVDQTRRNALSRLVQKDRGHDHQKTKGNANSATPQPLSS